MHHKLTTTFIGLLLSFTALAGSGTDVLVVGGGSSGTCAAISAARCGADVVLLEETPWLGGMLTSAGVSAIDGNYRMRGGLFGSFCDSLAAHYGGYEALRTGWVSNIQFEPSVGASILMDMVRRYDNIDVRLNTKVIACRQEKGGWLVTSVTGGSKSSFHTRILIDATELGDVAAACGVGYDIGMDDRRKSGESIAPDHSNNILQDLTYVAILKDYGTGADRVMKRPSGYDARLYTNCCKSEKDSAASGNLWTKEKMIDYGKLPGGKYMINWPAEGNDYYLNLLEMPSTEREEKLKEAKAVTLGFVYYIQTELGFRNLGLADDEFPTPDSLPLMPYYRESRRIHGLVRMTVDDAAHPYERASRLYRTGIGVGDYPVDHHHGRYSGKEVLPEIHFYPIPSFNVPLGAIIPEGVDNLIVAEKSISVSNIMNGATRLQPVAMQIGEAAGILGALSARNRISPEDVDVRDVQDFVLDNGGYIMPYLDVPEDDARFKAIQRIGATGILKGIGKHEGWSNQTWFNVNGEVSGTELVSGLMEYYPDADLSGIPSGKLRVSDILDIISKIDSGADLSEDLLRGCGIPLGREDLITRGQAAVLLDKVLDPFHKFQIGHDGLLRNDYTRYVDPMTGSGGHGHVFVGASVPHGMVQVGPDNLSEGWDWCSGYNYQDSMIVGFAQTHLSGTGIADLGDIVLMPVTGTPDIGGQGGARTASGFDKNRQLVTPDYYSVYLDRYGIKAEMTASERVAFHRYTFPQDSTSSVILDLVHSPKSLLSRTGCTGSRICVINDNEVEGYRFSDEWAKDHKVYFHIRFSEPFIGWTIYSDGAPVKGDSISGDSLKVRLMFGDKTIVNAAVGISFTSVEAAKANLENEYRPFDMIRAAAHEKWNRELGRIEFEGIDPSVNRIFYTGAYHLSIEPMLFADCDSSYRGADGRIYKAHDFTPYTVFSLWDTYRGVHPLYTLMDPREGDYVNSILDIDLKQGRMPVWHLASCETDCMDGVHSITVAADAALKGIKGVDIVKVYSAVKDFDRYPAPGIEYISKYGYIPADKVEWSVARGLEYCISDYAVARLAQRVGDIAAKKRYDVLSEGYRYYFDPSTHFMRGRLSDGGWRVPFDPSHSIHMEDDYVEGNAWQYTWLVPHDVDGLIASFGGRKSFSSKLDSLFTADSRLNEGASADITGMIGQYAHGNEPSHHIIYLNTLAGHPEKTARLVRQVDTSFYRTEPDGIIGNEDCGQMSAWYILSALGFYPVNPVCGEFVFGSPLAKKAVINLVNGKRFSIETVNNSRENIYIRKVELDGRPFRKESLSYDTIMRGGHLKYYMSRKTR